MIENLFIVWVFVGIIFLIGKALEPKKQRPWYEDMYQKDEDH